MAIKQPVYGENGKVTDWTETYPGAVLCTREENGYHDSDFYAIVWDEETQTTKRVVYHTTRAYSLGQAQVDATPEVIEKATAYTEKLLYALCEKQAGFQYAKGRTVKVIKGRKLPKGLTGTIFWIGKPAYAGDWKGDRVGIKLADDEKVFINKSYLELQITDSDRDNFKKYAAQNARGWHLPYTVAGYFVF